MQIIQLAILDPAFEKTLREALQRSGPWRVECIDTPHTGDRCVLVMDEASLARVNGPLPNPERIVLVTRKDPANLSHAWEAGIVSLVSPDDPPDTILLAIMAAALRVPKSQFTSNLGGFALQRSDATGPISPDFPIIGAKAQKIH